MLSKIKRVSVKIKNLKIVLLPNKLNKQNKEEMKVHKCLQCLKINKKKNNARSYSLHDEDELSTVTIKLHSKFGCTPAKIPCSNDKIEKDTVDGDVTKAEFTKKSRTREEIWQQAFLFSAR